LDEQENVMETRPRKLALLYGIIIYAAAIIMLIFVGSRLQYKYGMPGLAMTELIILAVTLLGAIVFRFDLQAAFPIRVPTGRQVGGTIVTWMGFWGLTISITMLLMTLIPGLLGDANESISDFASSVSFPARLLIMAIMPAICEEALFRGVVQSSMERLPRWPRILLIGLLFGIMHLDPVRIPLTATLGVGLALIMVKTNNLALPMLFHFINNALSTFATLAQEFLPATDAVVEAEVLIGVSKYGVIIACICGLGTPFLILAGNILLEPVRPHIPGRFADKKPQFIAAGAASGLFVLGAVAAVVMIIAE